MYIFNKTGLLGASTELLRSYKRILQRRGSPGVLL